MTDSLFTAAEVYSGDPLNPDTVTPTPNEIVAALTPEQRRTRVNALIFQAWAIVDEAVRTHRNSREIVARCVLFIR